MTEVPNCSVTALVISSVIELLNTNAKLSVILWKEATLCIPPLKHISENVIELMHFIIMLVISCMSEAIFTFANMRMEFTGIQNSVDSEFM